MLINRFARLSCLDSSNPSFGIGIVVRDSLRLKPKLVIYLINKDSI
jgi:hypothetical protein